MRNYIKYIILGVVLVVLLLLNPFLRKRFDKSVYYIRDTSLNMMTRKEFKRDTVIKVYEKIIYRRSRPEVVYVDKVDSNFSKELRQMDLIMRLEKKRNALRLTALNQKDSVIKEFRFNDVPDNFTVTSMKGDVFVKSANFLWGGLKAGIELKNNILIKEKLKTDVCLSTGFIVFDKIGIDGFVKHSVSGENLNNLEIGINLNYRLK